MGNVGFGSEGGILVRVRPGAGCVVQVDIASSRPLGATRMFLGRPIGQVLETLPLVFSICGTAQASAAVQATERALGVAASPAQQRARRLLLRMETAREHLFRILVGWSSWLGESPPPEALAGLGGLRGEWERGLYPGGDGFRVGGGTLSPDADALRGGLRALCELVETRVLGSSVAAWQALEDADELLAWAARGEGLAPRLLLRVCQEGWCDLGRSPVQALGALPEEEIEGLLRGEGGAAFIARPTWGGQVRETGPLVRQAASPLVRRIGERYGNGLLPRLAARIGELAELPRQIAALVERMEPAAAVAPRPPPAGPVSGIGQVEAARGRLIHRVLLRDGLVEGYQIVAPTEWNFHPQGVLYHGLLGMPVSDRLPVLAGLLVDAVDPCVAYQLQVG